MSNKSLWTGRLGSTVGHHEPDCNGELRYGMLLTRGRTTAVCMGKGLSVSITRQEAICELCPDQCGGLSSREHCLTGGPQEGYCPPGWPPEGVYTSKIRYSQALWPPAPIGVMGCCRDTQGLEQSTRVYFYPIGPLRFKHYSAAAVAAQDPGQGWTQMGTGWTKLLNPLRHAVGAVEQSFPVLLSLVGLFAPEDHLYLTGQCQYHGQKCFLAAVCYEKITARYRQLQ